MDRAEPSTSAYLRPELHLKDTEANTSSWIRGPLVGAGSFGSVHKCLCLDTGSLVAVKSSSSPINSSQMNALEREICLLKQLTSPRVIRYLSDTWGEDNSIMSRNLVMECAAGGSISSLLKTYGRGVGLPEPVVRRYTRDLLQGIRDIHAMGVAHLDIKGGNSLLTETGVKICDFGAARRVDSPQEAGPAEMRGTLRWMAPEIIQGNWGGMEADIWSLGCTVIEMVTGSSPWAEECGEHDWRAVMARVGCTEDVPRVPASLSEAGKDFLSRCLVRDKDRRWTAEELLQHPFLVEMGPQPTYSPTPWGRSPVSTLSPLRSFEPSESSCTADKKTDSTAVMGTPSKGGPPSFSLQEAESTQHSRESRGNGAEYEPTFSLFSACSGLPSPLLFSPLQVVASVLGSPAAETMEGCLSWVYQQNARDGLLKPCAEEDEECSARDENGLSLSMSGIPIAMPAEFAQPLGVSSVEVQSWNANVTLTDEGLVSSVLRRTRSWCCAPGL